MTYPGVAYFLVILALFVMFLIDSVSTSRCCGIFGSSSLCCGTPVHCWTCCIFPSRHSPNMYLHWRLVLGAQVIRVRKQGRYSGACQRLKRQALHRMPLPTIILVNVQSLHGKIDKLQANVKYLEEVKHAYVLALTEAWLRDHDLQLDLEIGAWVSPFAWTETPQWRVNHSVEDCAFT